MNSEVVHTLEVAFPAPVTLEDTIFELVAQLVADDRDRMIAVLLDVVAQTVGKDDDWQAWLAQAPKRDTSDVSHLPPPE
jgi:hypothetical protein